MQRLAEKCQSYFVLQDVGTRKPCNKFLPIPPNMNSRTMYAVIPFFFGYDVAKFHDELQTSRKKWSQNARFTVSWALGGTHALKYFALFASRAKINTYRSLKWHLHVLWHLNHSMTQDTFRETAFYLADRENGFVTFTLSEQTLETFIHDVSLKDLGERPPNKTRKIIFKDSCVLNRIDKLKIVGHIVGKRKLSETEIYDAMLLLHDDNEKLTIDKIAESLGVSARTIHRNMSAELKKEKELLNTNL